MKTLDKVYQFLENNRDIYYHYYHLKKMMLSDYHRDYYVIKNDMAHLSTYDLYYNMDSMESIKNELKGLIRFKIVKGISFDCIYNFRWNGNYYPDVISEDIIETVLDGFPLNKLILDYSFD